jgi:hypothetical protein
MNNYSKDVIGLTLCLLGMYVLVNLFPFKEILIIIPFLLFVISVFIKKQIWAIMVNTLTLIPFIIIYVGLRVPSSKNLLIDSKITYHMDYLRQAEGIRDRIEYSLNNRRVFLVDSVSGIKWLYVDNNDFLKLWPEFPLTTKANNFTLQARFKTYKLLNGDYSKATLVSFEKVEGDPVITK